MEGWKESLLNQAGKEILIKAVLQAIPTYAMAMVRFPKTFCAKICSSIARFWWRSNGKHRGIHWKSWESLTSNKSEGGLGFKDFAHMNSAFLAKQAWRIIQCPNALWVKVLESLYFPESEFLHAKRKRNASWVWSSLMHGRDTFLKDARWAVGRGDKIDIKTDYWLASGDLVNIEENVEVQRVESLINPISRCWDINKIRQTFPPDMVIKILQTPIAWNYGEDTLWWPKAKNGVFTVKSGYYQIQKQNQKVCLTPSTSSNISEKFWRSIWKVKIPQKIKFFM